MPHHRHLHRPDRSEPIEVRGHVAEWTHNHHGHRDGFILDDGAAVRFPPHLAGQVAAQLDIADEVVVIGSQHFPPHEPAHLDAFVIETAAGRLSLDIGSSPLRGRVDSLGHISVRDVGLLRGGDALPVRPSVEERLAGIEGALRELRELLREWRGTSNSTKENDGS